MDWKSDSVPTWGCFVIAVAALIFSVVWRIHDKGGAVFAPNSWSGLSVFAPAVFVALLMVVAAIINYGARHSSAPSPPTGGNGKPKWRRLQWANAERERLEAEVKRWEHLATQQAQSKPKIVILSEHSEYNGANEFPLKLRIHFRNDSDFPISVQYCDYAPELITLKKVVTETFQIRLAGAWQPQPNGLGQIAVLPTQQFATWIAADDGRFHKNHLDEHRGKIGMLVLLINGEKLEVKL